MDFDFGKHFFHYTPHRVAFDHILPEGQLRFSPYSRMRDPVENKKPRIGASYFDGEDTPPEGHPDHPVERWVRFNEELDPIWKSAKLLSLSIDVNIPDAEDEAARAARVKLVVQNHGHPSLTHAEFMAHWIERHGPLVREVGPALGYRRYVQDHPLTSPELDAYARGRGWRTPPDGGVTEVWWDSRESQLAAFASEEGQAASALMAEDEPRFVHPPEMTAFLCTEHVVPFDSAETS